MATISNNVEAVLSVRDQNFTSAMERAQKSAEQLGIGMDKANKGSSSFGDTLKGMAGAIGVTALISKGWDMITSSVGKAMDRIDVMDNFNRTMTLMTGSSEKAGFALDELRGKVSGTAYGLDTAARSAQGFVTSGMDIKDATRYVGGWMDAISTYGDGTNESLGRVTYQLTQMSTKGKVNLEDLSSAMEAGIPVIKIYAEATGQSTEQVSKSITKGEIAASDFMKVMDEAFRKGTKSFAGIEGAAKNAGGTWKGTFDNMQAATTRGVLSIIQSIENARKNADMPGMKDAVKEFGVVVEKILNGVAKVTGFVAEHFEALATVVTTGFAAWASYRVVDEVTQKFKAFQSTTQQTGEFLDLFFDKTQRGANVQTMFQNALTSTDGKMRLQAAAQKLNIELTKVGADGIETYTHLTDKQKFAILGETGVLTAKNILLGVLTGKIGLVSAAQLLWNKAMAANPIGTIIAVGTALIGVLKFINDRLNETSAEHKKVNSEAKNQADTYNSLVDSSKKLGDSYKESSIEAQANADEARRMVDGLKEIENSSMSAEEKQYMLAKAVQELNTKFPELQVELNDTGTAIEGGTDAIYKQIDAMHEMAKTEALKEYLTELYKKEIELQAAIDENAGKREEMVQSGTNVQKAWFGTVTKTTEGYKALEEADKSLQAEREKNAGLIESVSGKIKVQSAAELEAVRAKDAHNKKMQDLNETYGVTTDRIVEFSKEHNVEIDKMSAKLAQFADKYDMSKDDVIRAVDNMGGTLEDFAKTHEAELKKAEEAVGKYVSEASSGFGKIEQESTISLKKFLKNVKENQEAVAKWDENIKFLMESGVHSSLIQPLIDGGPAMADQAARLAKDVKKGGVKVVGEINSTLNEAVDVGYSAAQTSLEAKDYTALGEYPINDAVKGIVAQQPYLEGTAYKATATAVDKMAEAIIERQKGLAQAAGKSKDTIAGALNANQIRDLMQFAGQFGMEGLMKGIIETQGGVKSSAGKTREQILAEIPPDKLAFFLEAATSAGMGGLINGMLKEKPKATKAAKNVKDDVQKEFNAEELQANLTLASIKGIGGFVQGLIDTRGGAKNAAGQTRKEFLAQFDKDELATFMKIAADAGMDGFINTLINEKPKVEKEAKDVKKKATDPFNKAELNKLFLESSKAGIGGFVQGLIDTRNGAKNEAGQTRQEFLAQFDKNELKAILGTASKYGLDGFIQTLIDGKPRAKNAGEELKNSVAANAAGLDEKLKNEGKKGADGYVQSVRGQGQAAEGAGNVLKDKVVLGAKTGLNPALETTAKGGASVFTQAVKGQGQAAEGAGNVLKDRVIAGSKTGLNAGLENSGKSGGTSFTQSVKGQGQAAEGAGNVLKTSVIKGTSTMLNSGMTAAGKEAGNSFSSGATSTNGKINASGIGLRNNYLEGVNSSSINNSTGTAGRSANNSFATGANSQLPVVKNAGVSTRRNVIEGLSESVLRSTTNQIGTGAMSSLAGGVTSKQGDVRSASVGNQRAVISGLNAPSLNAETRGIGFGAMGQFQSGVQSKEGSVRSATGEIRMAAISGIGRETLNDSMYSTGRYAGQGFVSGLDSKEGDIMSKARELAGRVTSSIRKVLQIASPSKVMFSLASYTGEGFVGGLEKYIPKVDQVAQRIAGTVTGIDLSPLSNRLNNAAFARAPERGLDLVLHLGDQAFRAHIQNISRVQDREIELTLGYT